MINVIAELDRCGISYDWAGEEEVKLLCPFHSDKNPSLYLNVKKEQFKCQACKVTGDFVKLLARFLKSDRRTVTVDLSTRYDLDVVKTLDPTLVDRCHDAIWVEKGLLKELKDRAVTDSIIRQRKLGASKGRITIPIFDEQGRVVNIRRYAPGASDKKMLNTRGYGAIRLYPIDQLKYEKIVITGGEIKAIVGADQLNRYGIGCVTTTAGEGNWHVKFNSIFTSKIVYICMDVDEAGKLAANQIGKLLHPVVNELYIVHLDIDKEHGDINDYVASGKSLKIAINHAKPYVDTKVLVDEEPVEMSLTDAMHAKNAKKRFKIQCTVTAIDQSPYSIPRTVIPRCDRDQPACSICPVFNNTGKSFNVQSESVAILELMNAHKSQQREVLMSEIGIPPCNTVSFETLEFFNVEDVRLSTRLEILNTGIERAMQAAVCIGDGMQLNESYECIGRMYPHPRTQQSTLVISTYKPCEDALSTYKPSDLDRLKIFQPTSWTIESIELRLKDIYSDFAANITHIYMRDNLHLVVDLVYHSPLFIPFDGRIVKGWVEGLIVGDSAQGKSETTLNLRDHYLLGEKVECKNASVAGLLGGLQQLGKKWFVTWGVIPTHDKRLVVLEELKGASVELISRLTDMRSSGVAEIPKIEKRRTHARCRLIGISNPRSNQPLSTYNHPIQAVPELIGNPEDVRRFDIALCVKSTDVDVSELHAYRPKIAHRYTSDVCRELILWGWTLQPNMIQFECERHIFSHATALAKKYTGEIPLIDVGSTHLKLARLAASLAVRTASFNDETGGLLVRNVHTNFIVKLLTELYDSAGYDLLTDAIRKQSSLIDEHLVKSAIEDSPFPGDLVKSLLLKDYIDLQDIQDWCSWDRTDAQELLSVLVRKHALIRVGRSYRKTPAFIAFLKSVKVQDRPGHISEKDEF